MKQVEKKNNSIIDLEDVQSFFKLISKNWFIVVIFLCISSICAYFYSYKLPNIYAAKSQIILKSDNTYDYQNQLYKGLGYYYDWYQNNPNQIRVLTSNDLIRKALSKLKFDVSYYIKGRFKTREFFESVPFEVHVQLRNPSLYDQDIELNILDTGRYQLIYVKKEEQIVKTFPFDKEIIDDDFILTINKNNIISDKTIASLRSSNYMIRIHNMEGLVQQFKSALSIENIENTTILELTVEDEIPTKAISFLDTLSKVYIDYSAETQYKINENTIENIDKQLTGVIDILNSIEDDLEHYKSEKAVLDLPRQEEEYFKELISLDSRKRQIELYIKSLESLSNYILKIGDSKEDKLLPPSFYIGKDDDYLKTAINEVYTLQMNRNKVLYGATEDNTTIEQLDQTLNLLKKNMLQYISNSKAGLLQSITDLNEQIGHYTSVIQNVPRTQRGLLSIQRKVDVNEKLYIYLLEKRANTVIARAGILPETSVIEKAHSVGIVKPNKSKILYYFIIVGLILSLIIVFLRSVLFSTIESVKELKRNTPLPVLGGIVFSEHPNQYNYIDVIENPKSPIAESFRAIRTNLEYMASEAKSKLVLITSYSPGEGKTFCSVNLAAILARADKKVLLIELDLHKPKIQNTLSMSSSVGVSTILIGKADIASTILPTTVENLSVILSGPSPPNASEIILSKHLEEMLTYGREHFDYVIIDTPPIGLISDALVIMKNVDITLFILNAKRSKKHVVSIAEEIVTNNKIKNLGLILNAIKLKKYSYYNYNYGYTYVDTKIKKE